jgi:hypothetical protein
VALSLRPKEGKERPVDQPTAEKALKKLEPLVGDWILEARPPGGEAWPGGGRSTLEWHRSGAHLIQRTTVEVPEAPDSLSIMGCDAGNGTYFQLYSDDRSVCRMYEMSIGDGEWKLWRAGEPFDQRFIATISQDGNTIAGRWEKSEDGTNFTTDFELVYRRNLE